jgi:hypothetical protein
MSEAYNYTLSQFPNDAANISVLRNTVENDPAITTVLEKIRESLSEPVDPSVDFVRFVFASALSSAEETELNTIVSNHQAPQTTGALQRMTANAEQSTNLSSLQMALDKTVKPLVGGTYAVVFSMWLKADNPAGRCLAKLDINGETKARHYDGDDDYAIHGGTIFMDFEDGQQPDIQVQYRRQGGDSSMSVYIKYLSVALHLIETPEEVT